MVAVGVDGGLFVGRKENERGVGQIFEQLRDEHRGAVGIPEQNAPLFRRAHPGGRLAEREFHAGLFRPVGEHAKQAAAQGLVLAADHCRRMGRLRLFCFHHLHRKPFLVLRSFLEFDMIILFSRRLSNKAARDHRLLFNRNDFCGRGFPGARFTHLRGSAGRPAH